MKSVYVRVPASSGNVGPGFDVLGIALSLYNELEVTLTNKPGIDIGLEGEGEDVLPRSSRNLICRIVMEELQKRFPKQGIRIRMVNGIPINRGLGSSGAARLSAYAAAITLCGQDGVDRALTEAAREEGHTDNAAASFHGGLVASFFYADRVKAWRWPVPADLKAVVCIPSFGLPTHAARRVLPSKIPLSSGVRNLSAVAGILAAFSWRRYDGLAVAMEDFLHQPYRIRLIPGMRAVIRSAVKGGALGACLSGAGASILAICKRSSDLERIGRAMKGAFKKHGVKSRSLVLGFDRRGMSVQRG